MIRNNISLPIVDGQALLQARLKQSLEKKDLANALCLSAAHITQLEDGLSKTVFFSPEHHIQVAKRVGKQLGLLESQFLIYPSNEPEPISEVPSNSEASNSGASSSVTPTPVTSLPVKFTPLTPLTPLASPLVTPTPLDITQLSPLMTSSTFKWLPLVLLLGSLGMVVILGFTPMNAPLQFPFKEAILGLIHPSVPNTSDERVENKVAIDQVNDAVPNAVPNPIPNAVPNATPEVVTAILPENKVGTALTPVPAVKVDLSKELSPKGLAPNLNSAMTTPPDNPCELLPQNVAVSKVTKASYPATYVNLQSTQPMRVCLLDAKKTKQVIELLAGVKKTISVAAPVTILSNNLKELSISFQGWKLPTQSSPDIYTAILMPVPVAEEVVSLPNQ